MFFLITQWSKSSKILALSLGLFDLQGLSPFKIRCTQSLRCLLIYPIKWDNWLLRCLFLTKKGRRFSQTFYPFYKKMQNKTIIYDKCLSGSSKVHVAERKILQVRYLTYGWLFYKVHLPTSQITLSKRCDNVTFSLLQRNNFTF